jgi:hypothetical protein
MQPLWNPAQPQSEHRHLIPRDSFFLLPAPAFWKNYFVRITFGVWKGSLVVLSFRKDSRATISSVDHVINKTGLLPVRDSRHEQALSRSCAAL